MSIGWAVRIVVPALLVVGLLTIAPASAAAVGSGPATHADRPAALPIAAPKILYKVPLGKEPSGGAVALPGGNVFVSNFESGDVTIINATTHGHSSVGVGKGPDNLVFDPNNGNVYAPNENSASVSILSGASGKLVATVKLSKGAEPFVAYVDSDNGNVLVFNNSSGGSVQAWLIFNSTNAVKKLSLGSGIEPIAAYNPKSKDLYVPNPSLGVVDAIAPSGSIKSLSVPGSPQSVVYDPSGSVVIFVLLPNATRASEFGFITSKNAVGVSPPLPSSLGDWVDAPAAYDPTTHALYFITANYSSRTSYLVEINAVAAFLGAVTLGTGLFFGLAFDPANSDLDVGGYSSPVVDVINKNTTAVAKTLTTSQLVLFFVYDPSAKAMFGAGATNASTKSLLYEISSGNALSSVKVGAEAVAFAYDPVDTYVYVANIGSDSLDIVS